MAELRELVIQGPDPEIHKMVRWRCVDLKAEVARRFSVDVHILLETGGLAFSARADRLLEDLREEWAGIDQRIKVTAVLSPPSVGWR